VRVKLDENLPAWLAPALAKIGHDADTVRDEGLTGATDAEVFSAAQAERRFLVTQDLDFADTRLYTPGTHCGVLIMRLHSAGAGTLDARVMQIFAEEAVVTWSGCTVIASDQKVRVQRPGR
jgi:predicted nuclease of predicted toxin-antitoxin system